MSGSHAPSGIERTFGDEELLVSKTNLKGHIVYINDAFLRVSAYGAKELVGSAHNIIRHPDMPGGIYLKLWQTIQSGNEMFAYLNNLAKDGQNYWVIAHVTPTFDAAGSITGYHSNRRSPNREVLPLITELYAQMRRMERGLPGPQAARVSLEWFENYLADRGQTYDQFVWSLISGCCDDLGMSRGVDVSRQGARGRELVHV